MSRKTYRNIGRGGAPWLLMGVTVAALSAPLSAPAAGQQPACITVRTGDTALRAARLLTGNARNAAAPWFYIVEPGGGRLVPKTRYDTISAGSLACLATRTAVRQGTPWAGLRATAPIGAGAPTAPLGTATAATWIALAFAGVLMWRSVGGYLDRRDITLRVMKEFGDRFVREFERPLCDLPQSGRPIRSELRARPDRARLDVRLAPVAGRTYPNLSDHRSNVAYDVGRVLERLGDRGFVVRGPIYPQGSWVVVPFEFRGATKQAGGR